jgi:hypothetical protein
MTSSEPMSGKLLAVGMVLENSAEVRRVNTYEHVESRRGYGESGSGWMSPYSWTLVA